MRTYLKALAGKLLTALLILGLGLIAALAVGAPLWYLATAQRPLFNTAVTSLLVLALAFSLFRRWTKRRRRRGDWRRNPPIPKPRPSAAPPPSMDAAEAKDSEGEGARR